MAKFMGRPVRVDAFPIVGIDHENDGSMTLHFEGCADLDITPSDPMLARIELHIGDFLVLQPDGYKYFNPRDVFHRKYMTVTEIEQPALEQGVA